MYGKKNAERKQRGEPGRAAQQLGQQQPEDDLPEHDGERCSAA